MGTCPTRCLSQPDREQELGVVGQWQEGEGGCCETQTALGWWDADVSGPFCWAGAAPLWLVGEDAVGAAERVCCAWCPADPGRPGVRPGGKERDPGQRAGREVRKPLGIQLPSMWRELIRACTVLGGLARKPFILHPLHPWGTGQFVGSVWITSPTRGDSTPVS